MNLTTQSRIPIIVTGGAGFIGSNFVHQWTKQEKSPVVTYDKLTYAGNLQNLADLENPSLHTFVQGDITNEKAVEELLEKYQPSSIVHFAAETHVDRSIYSPKPFVETNVVGTCVLLEKAYAYWRTLPKDKQEHFRFLHVSTDEVYGSLGPTCRASIEGDPYAPNSPYAASKAASDHFVRSYFHTYGFPVITTFASNNFGPYQFPEKLIPLAIVNALAGKDIPLYGDGNNIRNWIAVEDHCEALRHVLSKGQPGDCYNIGGVKEVANKDLLHMLCDILDELIPDASAGSYRRLIKHVQDRPGHDRRYALDSSKIGRELGWEPSGNLKQQLKTTVQWYLTNPKWINNVLSGDYRHWVEHHYDQRGQK